MSDAQGIKNKKLKPLLIKSEPDRNMPNIYPEMTISLLYLRKILFKRGK